MFRQRAGAVKNPKTLGIIKVSGSQQQNNGIRRRTKTVNGNIFKNKFSSKDQIKLIMLELNTFL